MQHPTGLVLAAAALLAVGFLAGSSIDLGGSRAASTGAPEGTGGVAGQADLAAAIPPSSLPEPRAEGPRSVHADSALEGAAASATWRAAVDPASGPERPTDPLWDELETLLASDAVREQLLEEDGRLRDFLLARYHEFGRLDEAWDLLERTQGTPEEWAVLAERLARQAPARATEAYARVIDAKLAELASGGERNEWRDRNFLSRQLERLLALDPSLALATLERLELEAPDVLRLDPLQRARYLMLAGQGGAAEALFDEALHHPFRRADALDSLRGVDDAEAEALLRRFIEANGSDPAVEAALAGNLAEQGRFEEATDLIDGVLANGDGAALMQLEEALEALPDEVVAEHIDRWLDAADPTHAGGAAMGLLGDALSFYESQGQRDEAVGVQIRMLEALAQGHANVDWLPTVEAETALAHRGRIEPALRAAEAGAGSNDELWGDLGDLYWTLGLHQDAQRCWERASLIDPGDGEWSGNLGAIFDGSDPH